MLFILSLQGGKILGAGGDTAADGIIRLAGAVNAIDGYHRLQAAFGRGGDYGETRCCPDDEQAGGHAAKADDRTLRACGARGNARRPPQKRVIRMDGAYLLGFGPRTAEAITIWRSRSTATRSD
jgi:iron complex transport system substrate-binding protein